MYNDEPLLSIIFIFNPNYLYSNYLIIKTRRGHPSAGCNVGHKLAPVTGCPGGGDWGVGVVVVVGVGLGCGTFSDGDGVIGHCSGGVVVVVMALVYGLLVLLVVVDNTAVA